MSGIQSLRLHDILLAHAMADSVSRGVYLARSSQAFGIPLRSQPILISHNGISGRVIHQKVNVFCSCSPPKLGGKFMSGNVTPYCFNWTSWWRPLILVGFLIFFGGVWLVFWATSYHHHRVLRWPFVKVKAVLGAFLDLRLYLHKASKEMLWIDPQLSTLGWVNFMSFNVDWIIY